MTTSEQLYLDKIEQVVWKPSEELIPEDEKLLGKERIACGVDFVYFLKYAKIIGTPTFNNPGGVMPFELWPHLLEVIEALLTKRYLSILKSRQVGLSYGIAIYILWFVMFHTGANVLLFSRGQDEASELLEKCYRLYRLLPEFLKLKQTPNSTEAMGFPAMNSSIKAFPSTEGSGVGLTASIVVWDEHDEHPFAMKNFEASKPTIDSSGGQGISIFTVRDLDPNTLAKTLFNEAMEGKNDFFPLFFPWDVRPGRNQEWYDSTMRNIPHQELGGLTPELYMMRTYPASIKEALTIPSSISAFDFNVLEDMKAECKDPIVKVREGIDPKIVHIFQEYYTGGKYIAATDTSHGVGKDYSVTTVMNVKTGSVVADILSNTINEEELALHSVALLSLYHNPLWYIEANDCGGITIAAAQRLGYKHFGYQDEKKTKIGILMSGFSTPTGVKGTRTDLLGGLTTGINNHLITIFNKNGLDQFYYMQRNIESKGRIEALPGKNDDYPIAVGICWMKRDEVRMEDWKPRTFNTLEY